MEGRKVKSLLEREWWSEKGEDVSHLEDKIYGSKDLSSLKKCWMKGFSKGRKYLSGKCWDSSSYMELRLNEMHLCAVSRGTLIGSFILPYLLSAT